MRLMSYKGDTVFVRGGTVRVETSKGEHLVVPVTDLEELEGVWDGGPVTDKAQYVKLTLSEDQQSIEIESNGIFPEDMARFLALALHTVEAGNHVAGNEDQDNKE